MLSTFFKKSQRLNPSFAPQRALSDAQLIVAEPFSLLATEATITVQFVFGPKQKCFPVASSRVLVLEG